MISSFKVPGDCLTNLGKKIESSPFFYGATSLRFCCFYCMVVKFKLITFSKIKTQN
jgi:hypothetical protein